MLHRTPIVSVADEALAASIPGLNVLWAETQGDPAICVAMLDGPVDLSHPCFEGALLTPLETLASGVADDGPATAHGTHVASVIFGQPGCKIQGIAPGCRGLILPVFESRDGGVAPCSQIDLARAITQAVDYGAHVINISGGELSPSDEPHRLLGNAIRLCADNEVLIVAAAGNDGCECLHVPAAVPSVLGVGAMDAQGEPLDFSNWGTVYQAQGILAPGERVVGAVPGGGTTAYSGTSFATPIVSGVIALLLSLQRQRGEKPNPHTVRRVILSSAVGCDEQPVAECHRLLAGRLNLVGTLNHLTQGGSIAMSTKHENRKKEKAEEPVGATEASPEPSPGLRAAENAPSPPLVATPAATATYSPAWMPYTPSFVVPSSCGCGDSETCTCGAKPQLVYALGQLDYDFGSEARYDSFQQEFERHTKRFDLKGDKALTDPNNPHHMLAYLGDGTNDEKPGKRPTHASALIWTLMQDTTPIYAIQPAGAFASDTYSRLRSFLRYHHTNPEKEEYAERVSVPGILHGKVTLLNGLVVPVIIPDQRGMWAWTMGALIKHALGDRPSKETLEQRDEKEKTLRGILERIYYEIRNLGVTPQERALNYAATDAFQLTQTFKEGMALDSIEVEKSPICRPGSECWDVKLTFFDPDKTEAARHVFRFTIDVSDVIPMTVGPMRDWKVR